MKKYLLAMMLTFSGAALAQQVRPHVSNFGGHVNVNIWNHTNFNVTCTGHLFITTTQGRRDSIYIFERLWSRSSVNRNYRPRNHRDRIRFVNHSIFCH